MARLIQLDGKVVEEFSCLDGPLPEYIPPHWIGPHVGLRLIEAFRTLARMPMPRGPSSKSGYWPGWRMDWVDRTEIEREWRLFPYSDAAREAVADFARRKPKPTSIEVSHMEIAIGWPSHYLASRPMLCRVVLRTAMLRSHDLDLHAVADRMHKPVSRVRRLNQAALDLIAVGLWRDKVAVF